MRLRATAACWVLWTAGAGGAPAAGRHTNSTRKPRAPADGRRELITVDGTQREDDGELDPDDFLWEKLPGRCCFYGGPDPQDPSAWLGAHTCDECKVWDLPDNFCHASASACGECGMVLYCAPTPPLLFGNKVCTGSSRVGAGCDDTLSTGVCATHSVNECQNHCRVNAECEMLVFYPQERQGTCILCRDMEVYEHTNLESTRVYATTPAPPPPNSPQSQQAAKHYSTIAGPSPPPPPRPPPRPPARPPRPLSHLGRHHTRQHFECKFFPETEYAVDQSGGYTDRTAASKEECCNLCGLQAGCQDFVFEPSSGTCVLLPHVDSSQIHASANQYTVAGSLQITVVKEAQERHGTCAFTPSSGYSGGGLGSGKPLPGGLPIESKLDCCDACEREPLCAKLTYEAFGKTCILFEAYAEHYLTDGLLSGVLTSRASSGDGSGAGIDLGSHVTDLPNGAGGAQLAPGDVPAWMRLPPPPTPPTLVFGAFSPPPPPPPGENEAAKNIVADMSMGVAALMGICFCIFAYLFFSEDVMKAAHTASGGKVGKRRGGPKYGVAPTHEELADLRRGAKRKPLKSKASGKGGKGGKSKGLEAGVCSVRLETGALTQKKELFLGHVADFDGLRDALGEEFGHVFASRRGLDAMLVLCEAHADAQQHADSPRWLLVAAYSDIVQVLARQSLKVVEKPREHADDDYEVAHPIEGLVPKKRRPKKGAAAEPASAPADADDSGRRAHVKGGGRVADSPVDSGAPIGAPAARRAPARFADSDDEDAAGVTVLP